MCEAAEPAVVDRAPEEGLPRRFPSRCAFARQSPPLLCRPRPSPLLAARAPGRGTAAADTEAFPAEGPPGVGPPVPRPRCPECLCLTQRMPRLPRGCWARRRSRSHCRPFLAVPACAVNPAASVPPLRRMDAARLPSFARQRWVHASVDTFPGFIFAAAQTRRVRNARGHRPAAPAAVARLRRRVGPAAPVGPRCLPRRLWHRSPRWCPSRSSESGHSRACAPHP